MFKKHKKWDIVLEECELDEQELHLIQADRRGLTNGCILAVADALQIVYSEALYESYGLRRKEIATLFAVGYASSLFFGTFFAAAADYM